MWSRGSRGSQYWKLLLVWMSSRICCSSSSSKRPSRLERDRARLLFWRAPRTFTAKQQEVASRPGWRCWTHLGIRALASSAASGHRLAKLASSNLWSFFCRRRLGHTRPGQNQADRTGSEPGAAGLPAHSGDGLPVLEAAEPGRVVEGLHEDLWQLLLVLGALVLLLPVFQQHVDLRVQQGLCALKLCGTTTTTRPRAVRTSRKCNINDA